MRVLTSPPGEVNHGCRGCEGFQVRGSLVVGGHVAHHAKCEGDEGEEDGEELGGGRPRVRQILTIRRIKRLKTKMVNDQ